MSGKHEQRTFSGIELRAANDFALVGVAAAYDVLSNDLGGYRERIAKGAFTRSLQAGGDVKCLFNHDVNHILGRLKNKTLTLTDTPAGLAFRCQLNKLDSGHQGIYAMVQRRDIDECSFAFTVEEGGDTWDDFMDERGMRQKRRTLTNVHLFDVSVVTYPAYGTGTSAEARTAQYTIAEDWHARALRKAAEINAVVARDIAAGTFVRPRNDAERRQRAAAIGAQIARDEGAGLVTGECDNSWIRGVMREALEDL